MSDANSNYASLDLRHASPNELFGLYVRVLDELRGRGLVRSSNNPVADYAELLVSRALQLTQAPPSTAGFDAMDQVGGRYQIKARRPTALNPSRQSSPIRDLQAHHFDYLVAVVFAEDFTILRAGVIPFDVVQQRASYRKHVNGWVLHFRDNLWNDPEVRDITAELQAVA